MEGEKLRIEQHELGFIRVWRKEHFGPGRRGSTPQHLASPLTK